jgi:ribosomal protein S12 methylthiotransferase
MPDTIAVNIVSLGCAKNLVDTEVICGDLLSNNLLLAADPEDANVMLINTCSFIRDAREEADEAIREALAWKEAAARGSKRLVVVAGCLVQRDLPQCRKDYPGVDLFIGLDDISSVAVKINAAFQAVGKGATKPAAATADSCAKLPLPSYLYDHTTPRLTLTPSAYAYVKIAEGCDHRCAYCAIPGIRGKQRSRSMDSVVAECQQLLQQGVLEIIFIAQDSSRYGRDRQDGSSLAELLRRCDALPGDFWLRVLYTHPLYVDDELLELLAHGKHIVPYLDMPLQHISSPILKAMGRGMDGPQTRALMAKIRGRYPQLAVRTTFLLGFPGETEEDFQELLAFVRSYGFDRLGAFAFSPEDNTPAMAIRDGLVPEELAMKRRDELLAAQQSISAQKNKAMLGKKLRVLLEESEHKYSWQARSSADAPDVDQLIKVNTRPLRCGEDPFFAEVLISAAGVYDLAADLLPATSPAKASSKGKTSNSASGRRRRAAR